MTLKEVLEASLAHVPSGLMEAASPILAGELVRRAMDGEPLARRVILAAARAIKERPPHRKLKVYPQWKP